jgi:hypothetical protein
LLKRITTELLNISTALKTAQIFPGGVPSPDPVVGPVANIAASNLNTILQQIDSVKSNFVKLFNMIDPTQINPYSLVKYYRPNQSFRPLNERKLKNQIYTYDIVQSELGDKFSLPDGKYELRKSDRKPDI